MSSLRFTISLFFRTVRFLSSNIAILPSIHNCPIDRRDSLFSSGKISALCCEEGKNDREPLFEALILDLSGNIASGPLCKGTRSVKNAHVLV